MKTLTVRKVVLCIKMKNCLVFANDSLIVWVKMSQDFFLSWLDSSITLDFFETF